MSEANKEILSKTYLASALILFALLPMTFRPIYTPFLAFFFLAFIADYAANKRYRGFLFTLPSVCYLCVIAYFLLLFLFWPIESDDRYIGSIAEQSLSLLAFPLVGLAGGFNEKFKVKYFAAVGVMMPLVYAAYIINIKVGWGNYFQFTEYTNWMFNDAMNRTINAHMGFNLYCNLAILLTYHTVKECRGSSSKLDRFIIWFCPICCVPLIGLIIQSQARIGLLCMVLVLFYMIADLLRIALRNKKWVLYLLCGTVLAAGLIFVITRPRFDKEVLDKEPRNLIWDISMEKIMEAPLLGHGCSTGYKMLDDEYLNTEGMDTFLTDNIKAGIWWGGHPHNQLLQGWLSYGILGLLLMAAIMILPFFALRADKYYPIFAIFWLCIVLQLQTEIIQTSVTFINFGFYHLFILAMQGSAKPLTRAKDAQAACPPAPVLS